MSDSQSPFALPSLAPPEGVTAARLVDVVNAARAQREVHVTGARGSATSLVVARLAELGKPIVLVVKDGEEAERAAQDLAFYLPKGDPILSLPEWECYSDYR